MMMNIQSRICKDGFKIRISKNYSIRYPSEQMWSALNEKTRLSLKDNITYLKMAPYAALVKEPIVFNTREPILKDFIDKCIRKDLPRFAFEDKLPVANLRKSFRNSDFKFRKGSPIIPEENIEPGEGGVLAFSFGKESLLSYSVMKELGIPVKPVYVEDTWDAELYHKKALMDNFEKEFGDKVEVMVDEFDNSSEDPLLCHVKTRGLYGCGAMNGYMLMLLPFAHHFGMNSIVFGNEHNFNEFFRNEEQRTCYPSYEQSSAWMMNQNKMLGKMTNGKVGLRSYVEPLYSVGEMKVLLNRYPKVSKYLMSCIHDPYEDHENKWCQGCSACITVFLYTAALGHNPKKLGFTIDLFRKESKKLYRLFNERQKSAYDKAKEVRDGQLFAFYLAYKNKFKGYLIDEFKKKFLKEAIERQEELVKKYLGIHRSVTIPRKYKSNLLSIYREELDV
jgi:hypothetical protein